MLETSDGAPTAARLHVNNANMYTPPDGTSPMMQMYLWRRPSCRTINGGDDASILYHEYTHGLSNRLIRDAGGAGALNSPQAGAMGEGWSDWYAKDFLVPSPGSTPRASGEVHMGDYTDARRASATQALDCPVGASAGCPGGQCAGRRLHLRRLRQDRRRAGGPRRRRDLGADAVGPAARAIGSATARQR